MTVQTSNVWKMNDGSFVIDMGILVHLGGERHKGTVHAADVPGAVIQRSLDYTARLNAGDFYIDVPDGHSVAILKFKRTIMGRKVWEGTCNYDMERPGAKFEEGVIFRITEMREADSGYSNEHHYRAECECFAAEKEDE